MRANSGTQTEPVGFLLVPKFPMLAFSAAVEPLRIANWLSGRALYSWRLFTEDGRPVEASNGIPVMPHASIASIDRFPLMISCAGVDGCHYRSRRVFAWLRSLSRNGTEIGGIGTGAYLLARAGLLAGHRCTIHWEEFDNFQREFPDLEVTDSLYEMDRGIMTCPGGTAALDMMLRLIEARHGRDLAGEIAEEFIQHRIRDGHDPQRTPLQARLGIRDPRLIAAVDVMEDHIEEPLSLKEICSASGLSLRHLQRMFMTHFGRSPTSFYRDVRLRHARQMLLHGSQSILDVAVATGFVSGSHFTRRYRTLFGRTPRSERRGH